MFRRREILVERESIGNVNFTDKKNPAEGVASLVIGILSIVIFLALSAASTVLDGKGSLWLGLIGCLAWMGNVFAIVLAMKALKKEDSYHKLATVGGLVNGFAAIGYVAIYVYGVLA